MRKNKDYRTRKEKIYDFMYKHRKKIIIYSFVMALIMFLVSGFTSNKGGLYMIILYPLALLGFILDLRIENGGRYIRFSFSLTVIFIAIVLFIVGFFVAI